MLIDIPIYIAFNTDPIHASAYHDGQRVFTMRYDIHDEAAPAQYTDHFPPRANATWSTDTHGVLFALFARTTEERIKFKAMLYPPEYRAGVTESARLPGRRGVSSE